MSLANALPAALYSKLTGTSGLTALLAGTTSVYNIQAPDDASLDYVVFNIQAGGDDNESAHRTKDLLVFIRGYSSVNASMAGSIDAQIDTALHMKPLTISGWANFWISRERDFANVEIDASNFKTWMAGAYYRIRAEKT